jgi:hypothetical protein
MILSHTDGHSFSFENVDGEVIAIVLHNLVGAFPQLTLSIKHKTTTENHYLARVLNS